MKAIREILDAPCVRVDVAESTKERVLGYLSEALSAADASSSAAEILAGLFARESLGSTGIGGGVAIPHCRPASCPRIRGALIRLREPIEFDSIDRAPVDLVFALLGPEDDRVGHLEALAAVAKRFNQPSFAEALRTAADQQSLYEAAIALDPA